MQLSHLPQTVEEIEALLRGAKVYPRSVQHAGGETICFAKDAHQHYLLIVFNPQSPPFLRESFGGEVQDVSSTLAVKWCWPGHSNAKKLRVAFPWTAPRTLGTTPDCPVRDLIGLAAPALLQAHAAGDYDFALSFEAAPRELAALSRTMDEALDAVSFAVFQENYRRPWAMRAADLNDAAEQEKYEKLGYTEFAFAGDVTDFVPGESAAWQQAAQRVIIESAPQLAREITESGASFAEAWTHKTASGAWRWRDRIYRLLLDHETEYFQLVRDAAAPLFIALQNDPLRNE